MRNKFVLLFYHPGKWSVMHMCVRCIKFGSVITMFLLDCGTLPTLWYYLLSILCLINVRQNRKKHQDNSERPTRLDTQDTGRRQTLQNTTTQKTKKRWVTRTENRGKPTMHCSLAFTRKWWSLCAEMILQICYFCWFIVHWWCLPELNPQMFPADNQTWNVATM